MKSKLKCRTEAKAQVNFRKGQRTVMNRANRRLSNKFISNIELEPNRGKN